MGRRTLLIVVNWDWFFLSHRLPIALAAAADGYRVVVATVDTGRGNQIRQAGLEFIPLRLSPHGMNPIAEARTLVALARLYRRVRPDLIHHVTIKPVLYGSIAARFTPKARVVNAISGLGQMFGDSRRARATKFPIRTLYRAALSHPRSRTIIQNPDDLGRLLEERLAQPGRTVLIRGSGVDCEVFQPTPEPDGPPVVVLPARLMWEKGVGEFVAAAHIVRARVPEARLALVGAPDPGNPGSVPGEVLEEWRRKGVVEFWGHRDDMPDVLASAHIVALPSSYPEGLPKTLLEAAAAGRAMITTDTPGCREVVRHEDTGLLIPPRDSGALAAAILRLIEDPPLRARLAKAGRALAEHDFHVDLVVRSTLTTYDELFETFVV